MAWTPCFVAAPRRDVAREAKTITTLEQERTRLRQVGIVPLVYSLRLTAVIVVSAMALPPQRSRGAGGRPGEGPNCPSSGQRLAILTGSIVYAGNNVQPKSG
jgi:hypothetical protein